MSQSSVLKFSFFFIFILNINKLFGQINAPVQVDAFPPSPTASSLGKFVDLPVSLYTGTPQIDIPIWDVKEGNIHVPVSLNYHSGGIQVAEMPSWVGLGWALNAGGVITRTVRGLPDDLNFGYLDPNLPLPTSYDESTQKATFVQYANGGYDSQPDLFRFNFGSRIGSFQLDQSRVCHLVPFQKVKIESFPATGQITSWKVTTEDGFIYNFDVMEQSRGSSYCANSGSTPPGNLYGSSWFLSKITSPTGAIVTFEYETGFSYTYTISNFDNIYYPYHVEATSTGGNTMSDQHCYSMNDVRGVRLKKLKFSLGEIEFTANNSRLDLQGDKSLDLITVRDYKNNTIRKFVLNYQYMLGDNLVSVGNGSPSTQYRLALVSVKETDATGLNSKPSYDFTYNMGLPDRLSCAVDYWGFYNGQTTNNTLVAQEQLTNPNVLITGANCQSDINYSIKGTINKVVYPTGGSTSFIYELNDADRGLPKFAQRTASLYSDVFSGQAVKSLKQTAFTVNSIGATGAWVRINVSNIPCNFTPTTPPSSCGIFITISKELNGAPDPNGVIFNTLGLADKTDQYIYLNNGNYFINNGFSPNNYVDPYPPYHLDIYWNDLTGDLDYYVGGLRIKKMITSDPVTNKNLTKIYDYKDDTQRSSGRINNLPKYGYWYYMVQSEIVGSATIWYSTTYYVRTSSPNVPLGLTQGSQVGYGQVTVYYGEDNTGTDIGLNGKSTFKYTNPGTYPDKGLVDNTLPFPPVESRDWMRGLLLEQTDYKRQGSAYLPIKKLENQYMFHDEVMNTNSNVTNCLGLKVGYDRITNGVIDHLNYKYFNFNTGYQELVKSIETIYDDDDITKFSSKEINFTYSINHLQRISTQTTLSDGNKIVSWLTYPTDYTNSSGFIQDMKTANIINKPIEEYTYKTDNTLSNPNVISGNITTYNAGGTGLENEKWNLEISQPLALSSFKISNKAALTVDPASAPNTDFIKENNYRRKITFNSYDLKGNLISYNKENDINVIQLWGYNNNYPIAEIKNALPTQVFYENFEETGSPLVDVTSGRNLAKTGRNVGINTYTFTTSLPAGNYKMTYWTYDGTKWNFNSVNLNYSVSTTPSPISTTSGYKLDEIRIFPVNSIITTYSYDPLIGMIDHTDENGLTTYYEYDSLGRLTVVRNNDRNIINSNSYIYAKP